jgi:hypothetical protein
VEFRGYFCEGSRLSTAFIAREKASIEDMRRHLWPSPKDPSKGMHPDRWTGRNLFEDVRAADAAYGDQIRASLRDQQFNDVINDLNILWRELRDERARNYERLMREYEAGGRPSGEGE